MGLLDQCTPATIFRLSRDSTRLPSDKITRTVVVDWKARTGDNQPQRITREVGWSNLPQHLKDVYGTLSHTFNEHRITEDAAIGVLALLIHDLEKAEILSVLQIGSGGDYLLKIGNFGECQAECSGIREDANGSYSRDRVRKKSEQVLSRCAAGFASVTTFCHAKNQEVHSYLHYVTSDGGTAKTDTTAITPRPVRKQSGKKRKQK